MSFGHCANLTAVVKFLLLVVSIILSITQVLLQQIVMSKESFFCCPFYVHESDPLIASVFLGLLDIIRYYLILLIFMVMFGEF